MLADLVLAWLSCMWVAYRWCRGWGYRVKKSLGLSVESGPENRTLALRALCARSRRRSSREFFAGRRSRVAVTLRGGRRMARKGLCSSMGWRRSAGRVSRSITGTGGFVLAGRPCVDLSRRIHVRTSLTLATKVSLVFDDAICTVYQRMLLSSSRVSVATTVQGPSVFSLNFHPRMSRPVSDEGRCRVDDVAGIVGAMRYCAGLWRGVSWVIAAHRVARFWMQGLGCFRLQYRVV